LTGGGVSQAVTFVAQAKVKTTVQSPPFTNHLLLSKDLGRQRMERAADDEGRSMPDDQAASHRVVWSGWQAASPTAFDDDHDGERGKLC
jgi:hypothetical protein